DETGREWPLTAPGIHGEHVPMRDLSREEVDFCVVGAGAGGGVLGAKLAEAGFSVVILDAGPHWNPTKDFVSDETASRKLFWTDERITGGDDPVELGSNNSGQGVGGGTVHYSMIAMRAHPDDFRRRTLEGEVEGADLRDWPLTFEELEPYYEEVEDALQIAGPTFYPWGKRRRRYPQREHELNASAQVLVRGCTRLGIPVAPAPIATLSAPHRDRPPCVYRGFCNYGCTTNAKSSILVTYIPRAIHAGAEVRAGAMVAQIEHDERGHVTGVLHFRKGSRELFRQRAKNVVVAGYAVETPRLLLNSAGTLFPDGLANSSGMVGRCFMVHSGQQVFAKFPRRINQYKAPPPGGALTEHFNRTMPDADFICGYTVEVVGPHPVDFASRLATARGLWGARLRRAMMDYNYYSGIGIVGEILPQARNMVKLHETERDQYGLLVPHVVFGHHENDRRLVEHSIARMKEIMEAAGGSEIWSAERTAHLLGTCRMGRDPKDSVVNADCRAHDVPNLFVCDGSVFPTSTAVNPSLTIEAIAARTADRIVEAARRGELSL
ncbi:MAG TPA: GMC family oxidoreductase, partial [Pyrinomonadaceae bacterium]|nr:GMC family oxidoreductase [Pyrinomonadaceae bacterium]